MIRKSRADWLKFQKSKKLADGPVSLARLKRINAAGNYR